MKNCIFFWQDLAANGTNIEVAEAAKAHLDSYRYKRHFNYILISNSLKFELFEVQLNWGFIISHHCSMKYFLPSNMFYPLYFAPRLLSQTKRWSQYLITRQPIRSSALYTTPICFSLCVDCPSSVLLFTPAFDRICNHVVVGRQRHLPRLGKTRFRVHLYNRPRDGPFQGSPL